jgi:hypothetical protein
METNKHIRSNRDIKEGNWCHLDNDKSSVGTIAPAMRREKDTFILSTSIILIRRKNNSKIRSRKTVLVPNMSAPCEQH